MGMQTAMEWQMANLDGDAVLEAERPSSCLPLFSDVYSKRFVCLTKPPAGMSTMPVRSPTLLPGIEAGVPQGFELNFHR